MKGRDLLVLLAVLAILAGGVTVYQSIEQEKAAVRAALRDAAVRGNIDPDIMEAIGYVESRWRLGATNLTGPDGARGGAYGPTQITERTARAYGYTGPMSALTKDPVLAANWTAIILNRRPGGAPITLEDAAAWWNAGRASFTAVPADNTARTDYAPRLIAAWNMIIDEREA